MIKKIVLIAIIAIGAFYTLNSGIKTSEKNECTKWLADSKEYGKNWYSTDWQKEQCEQYGVKFEK